MCLKLLFTNWAQVSEHFIDILWYIFNIQFSQVFYCSPFICQGSIHPGVVVCCGLVNINQSYLFITLILVSDILTSRALEDLLKVLQSFKKGENVLYLNAYFTPLKSNCLSGACFCRYNFFFFHQTPQIVCSKNQLPKQFNKCGQKKKNVKIGFHAQTQIFVQVSFDTENKLGQPLI